MTPERKALVAAAVLALAAGLYLWLPSPSAPTPASPAVPAPDRPKPPRKPCRPGGWEARRAPAVAGQPRGEPEPMVDLLAMPRALRPANVASKGSGCCTFRSAEWAAQWQHEPALYGLPEWMQ